MSKYTTTVEAIAGLLASENMEIDQLSHVKGHIETDDSMHKEVDGQLTKMCGILAAVSTKEGKKGIAMVVIDFRETHEIKFASEMDPIDILTAVEMNPKFAFIPRTRFREGDSVIHKEYGHCIFIYYEGPAEYSVLTDIDPNYRKVKAADVSLFPGFEMGHTWERRT